MFSILLNRGFIIFSYKNCYLLDDTSKNVFDVASYTL